MPPTPENVAAAIKQLQAELSSPEMAAAIADAEKLIGGDVVDETTDRYGRPLDPAPTAVREETDPLGVHVIPMYRPKEYGWAKERGHGVAWYDAHSWTTDHVLRLPDRATASGRWQPGYCDDASTWNTGQGMLRKQGRHLYVFEHSSCIAAHPEMGTAAEIRRSEAAGREHHAKVGDLVVLQCIDLDGSVVETVAARIVPVRPRGPHIDLQLVERD